MRLTRKCPPKGGCYSRKESKKETLVKGRSVPLEYGTVQIKKETPQSGAPSAVSVIGLGKLGAPMAACLAAKGRRVIGVDVDARKVEAINEGFAPVFETGLEELIGRSNGRLRATGDITEAVATSEITFIVVATPSEATGGFSNRYVLSTCEAVGRALRAKRDFHVVAVTSTVMPGSTGGAIRAALELASGRHAGEDFGLCYNPEFIALGSVIRDFLNPDFVLIGESDSRSGDALETLYREICDNVPRFARMNLLNAEIAKLSVNAFVTTKISFANMLARMCERLPGADVDVVTAALGLDNRIGAKYLKGSVSYGGPCFPRDNLALAAFARSIGAPADIAEATHRFNLLQIDLLAGLVKKHLISGGRAGILGLTYKPSTDVVEQAAGYLLAQKLAADGVSVLASDPAGNVNAAQGLDGSLVLIDSAEECIERSDVVVVATAWPQYKTIPAETWTRSAKSPRVVIDCWRSLGVLENSPGIVYLALGAGETSTAGEREAMRQSAL
jgi:UDPglucose 6-dehydrogenase